LIYIIKYIIIKIIDINNNNNELIDINNNINKEIIDLNTVDNNKNNDIINENNDDNIIVYKLDKNKGTVRIF